MHKIRVYKSFNCWTAMYKTLYICTGYNTALAAINAVKELYRLTGKLMQEAGYSESDAVMSIKYEGYSQHIKQISSGNSAT